LTFRRGLDLDEVPCAVIGRLEDVDAAVATVDEEAGLEDRHPSGHELLGSGHGGREVAPVHGNFHAAWPAGLGQFADAVAQVENGLGGLIGKRNLLLTVDGGPQQQGALDAFEVACLGKGGEHGGEGTALEEGGEG